MPRLPRVQLEPLLLLLGLGPRDGLGEALPAEQLRVPLLHRLGEELVVESGVAEVDRPRGRVDRRVHLGQQLEEPELVERGELGEGGLVQQQPQVDLTQDGVLRLEVQDPVPDLGSIQ